MIPIKFNKKQTEIMDQEVLDLVIVEKKNGKFRPVINLMRMNEFISNHHFKMETLDVVLSSIKRNLLSVNSMQKS